MAFADPQSLTVGSDTFSLPRTGFGDGSGRFSLESGDVELRISHQKGKRARSVVRVDMASTYHDPLLDAGVLVPVSMSVQLVVDRPLAGFDSATRKAVVTALASWLTASSGANTAKFLGGES